MVYDCEQAGVLRETGTANGGTATGLPPACGVGIVYDCEHAGVLKRLQRLQRLGTAGRASMHGLRGLRGLRVLRPRPEGKHCMDRAGETCDPRDARSKCALEIFRFLAGGLQAGTE